MHAIIFVSKVPPKHLTPVSSIRHGECWCCSILKPEVAKEVELMGYTNKKDLVGGEFGENPPMLK